MLKLKCSDSIKSTNIQHSVLTNVLFSRYAGCSTIAGPFTTGTYQIQAAFHEPCVLVVSDTRADQQPITNKSPHSIGLLWWMLTRRIQRLRGIISRGMSVSVN